MINNYLWYNFPMQNTNQEFEVKVLDINVEEIVSKLRELGAYETGEVLMRRYVFDFNPDERKFIRLRDNGKKVTLTYKHRPTYELGDTTEIETDVIDFDKTAQILSQLPIDRIFYQENKRWVFQLGEIEFSIDTWPLIPPHLEIEASSKEEVLEGLKLLGLVGKDVGNLSVAKVYKQHGMDIHSFKKLTFTEQQ